MRALLTSLFTVGLFTVSLGATALADDIYLTDGKTLSDVDVTEETMSEVTYKSDRKTETVASDKVLSISYSEKPQLVDQGDAAMAGDLFVDAEAYLYNFLDGVKERVPSKHKWSRAYAYYRLVTVYGVMGEVGDLATTADEMAALEPDSRYLPIVMALKAQVLADSGDKAKALSALGDLEKLASSKGLGDRWTLEVELGKVLYGPLTGGAQRQKLEDISGRAGTGQPIVRNKAEASIGASFLAEGMLPEAEKVLSAVVADPKADDRTLAAAYTGLGQCLFRRGEAASDPALLSSALKAYMRVVVLYKKEINYLPEALFFAGRCFQLLEGEGAEDNAYKLYSHVMRTFPDSRWAKEARGFRKKKS